MFVLKYCIKFYGFACLVPRSRSRLELRLELRRAGTPTPKNRTPQRRASAPDRFATEDIETVPFEDALPRFSPLKPNKQNDLRAAVEAGSLVEETDEEDIRYQHRY